MPTYKCSLDTKYNSPAMCNYKMNFNLCTNEDFCSFKIIQLSNYEIVVNRLRDIEKTFFASGNIDLPEYHELMLNELTAAEEEIKNKNYK
jgi:hypothetical protein